MTYWPAFGTPARKIVRANAPDTSRDAGYSVDTVRDEERVYNLILSSKDGLTIKEAARRLNKFPNQISGRFTALRDKGLIEDTGKRREKSRVMAVVKGQRRLL